MPYYFILDKNYQVSHLFVADPNNHQLTEKYLSYIYSLFNTNEPTDSPIKCNYVIF